MISKIFTKQIVCGVVSALGFSGSVYFIIKQTEQRVPVTSVSVSNPGQKKDDSTDLTTHIDMVKNLGIDEIDLAFQILNKMQENGIVPTLKELLENQDKWILLIDLLKECFPDGNNSRDKKPINKECNISGSSEDKKLFLNTFLKLGDKIKELMKQNKEAREKAVKENQTPEEKLTTLKTLQQLMNAKSLSESPDKDSYAHEFLKEFKNKLTSASGALVPDNSQLMQDLDSLIAFHSALAKKTA